MILLGSNTCDSGNLCHLLSCRKTTKWNEGQWTGEPTVPPFLLAQNLSLWKWHHKLKVWWCKCVSISLVPRPCASHFRLHEGPRFSVLQAMISWAGSENKAISVIEWDW